MPELNQRYKSYKYNPYMDYTEKRSPKERTRAYEQAGRYEDLYNEYRQLAKKADQRLVRLERYAEQEHFAGVLNWAYKSAMRDIATWGEDGQRFNTAPPQNIQQLQAKINDIKKFLALPTSTKKGITDVYKKRADTLNKNHGTNFTWQELANFFEGEYNKKLDSKFGGSSTLLKALGALKKAGLTPEDVADENFANKRLASSDVVNEMAHRLAESGIYNMGKLFE